MRLIDFPFLKRAIPSLERHILRKFSANGYRIAMRGGGAFLLDHENFTDREIIYRGIPDQPQRQYLLSLAAPGRDLFLDVGAHNGIYSIDMGRARVCRRLVAFEPDPRNFGKMCANLLLNGLSEIVEARQEAVSDHAGTVRLAISRAKSTTLSRVSDEGTPVASVRLDDLFPVSGLRIVVKIDVEEHELAVLCGAEELLRNNDCTIQLECLPANHAAVFDFLSRLGYVRFHQIGIDHYLRKSAGGA